MSTTPIAFATWNVKTPAWLRQQSTLSSLLNDSVWDLGWWLCAKSFRCLLYFIKYIASYSVMYAGMQQISNWKLLQGTYYTIYTDQAMKTIDLLKLLTNVIVGLQPSRSLFKQSAVALFTTSSCANRHSPCTLWQLISRDECITLMQWCWVVQSTALGSCHAGCHSIKSWWYSQEDNTLYQTMNQPCLTSKYLAIIQCGADCLT